jgi:K(+)-stimulated pyrophosphate-energized sodium pump
MGSVCVYYWWFFQWSIRVFRYENCHVRLARAANAAQKSLNDGLKVAFRSGAVMGLVVVVLDYLIFDLVFCPKLYNRSIR